MLFLRKLMIFMLLFVYSEMFAEIAKVVAFSGDATILREGKEIKLTKDSLILNDDEIKTKDHTKLQLLFNDNTIISIGKNSLFKVKDYIYDEKNNNYNVQFNMTNGVFRTITGKIGKIAPNKFKLNTKSASIGIRGTQIVLNLTNTQENIFCTEGKIFVEKRDENLSSLVEAGKFITIDLNQKNDFEIKDIKESDIKNINNNISIKENFPIYKLPIADIPTKDENISSEEVVQLNNEILINPSLILTQPTEISEDKDSVTLDEQLETKQEIAEDNQEVAEDNYEAANEEVNEAQEDLEEAQVALDNAQTDEEREVAQVALDEAQENLEDAQEELTNAQENLTQANDTLNQITDTIIQLSQGLDNLTPEDYFTNNISTASYSGDFNATAFDSGQQYLMNINRDKVTIPTDTTISMDIDFGAVSNQISNGEISISDVGDGSSRTLTFDGSIDASDSSFDIAATGDTKGAGGVGYFYGTEADLMKGDVNLKTSDNVQIDGSFEATKQ